MIGQGDPFFPVLFPFCVSLLLREIQAILDIEPSMYADDLASVIPRSSILRALPHIMDTMDSFSRVSGLRLNLGKSGVVLKGSVVGDVRKTKCKILRCANGAVTTDEAFARVVHTAQLRAHHSQHRYLLWPKKYMLKA